ncbi:hypothetical protein ACFS7Z_08120 [Pontibacter toksunensis]|uniref:Uncharacterized protein n=1 Tax=Pontibacter toksunensis TaxID=1332631 RepID=A0ABW6BTQ5_9BACT
MKNLKDIFDLVMSSPTIMRLDKEILIFKNLMSLNEEHLLKEQELLYKVLDRLYESHIQAYMEVNDENKQMVYEFADWLGKLALKKEMKDTDFLIALSKHFETTV